MGQPGSNVESTRTSEALRSALKSQYHAALAMLREAIEKCPDELWASDEYTNRFWRIAYHTLYFTHLGISDPLKFSEKFKSNLTALGKGAEFLQSSNFNLPLINLISSAFMQ